MQWRLLRRKRAGELRVACSSRYGVAKYQVVFLFGFAVEMQPAKHALSTPSPWRSPTTKFRDKEGPQIN